MTCVMCENLEPSSVIKTTMTNDGKACANCGELIENIEINEVKNDSHNNGGDTDYYDFKSPWKECQDIIEDRKMNFSQGNIFKVGFCFNTGRHIGTNYERDLNKIIFFAKRELERIKE